MFGSVEEIAAALRASGGRFSATRRRVLEALFAADGPVSADHIAGGGSGGRTRRLDLTSVYRTLERLEELGVVRHVHIGHGPGLYALAGSGEREYLVCERCQEVTSVDASRLDATRAGIRGATGYEARFSHFPIVGLCPRCVIAMDRVRERGGAMTHDDKHSHDSPHTHEHSHGDVLHAHPHTDNDHDHVEHDHEHSHGDRLHSHPHVHEEGLLDKHEHEH